MVVLLSENQFNRLKVITTQLQALTKEDVEMAKISDEILEILENTDIDWNYTEVREIQLRNSDVKSWINNPKLNEQLVSIDRYTTITNDVKFNDGTVKIFDLFVNNEHIGVISYYLKKHQEEQPSHHWFLNNIVILPEKERQGHGSFLLEKTCKIVWSIEKLPICLNAPNGENRPEWYEKRKFKGNSKCMVRNPPSSSD
ncbi:GNAT family N-acetyltransferase [Planktothrix prolifica]|uniref:GNAT family N-acetyltransferase n=1 Tax=Planktothrix prolifica TaxID=54307 RepID=UPI00041452E4|nr:GNAT family N-acetyltransferase [Planktothrix prolifica]CAD5984273.1 GCN5-related N-acetyltransferase [Planktothrix rubescens]